MALNDHRRASRVHREHTTAGVSSFSPPDDAELGTVGLRLGGDAVFLAGERGEYDGRAGDRPGGGDGEPSTPGDSSVVGQPEQPQPQFVPEFQWRPSYEADALAGFLAEADSQRASLADRIKAAKQRVERARSTAAGRAADEAQLGARILAVHHQLESMERESRAVVASIERAADEEVSQILSAAREEAAALRAAAALTSRVVSEATRDRRDY